MTTCPAYVLRASSTVEALTLPVAVMYFHEGSGMSWTGGSRMAPSSSLVPPYGTVQSIQPTLPGLPPHSGIVSSTPVSQVRVGSSGTDVCPDPQARTVTGKAIGSKAQPARVSMQPADGPETAVAGCVRRQLV